MWINVVGEVGVVAVIRAEVPPALNQHRVPLDTRRVHLGRPAALAVVITDDGEDYRQLA